MPPLSLAQVQSFEVINYPLLKLKVSCSKKLDETESNKDILSFSDSITPKANKNDLQSLLSGT